MLDYAQVEEVAAWLCNTAGGDWPKPYTKRNRWRKRAMALDALARGDMAGAEKIMAGAEKIMATRLTKETR